jgi:hypothetical protein
MKLELIAKFSLIDKSDKQIADIEVGKIIEDVDLEYSVGEIYSNLRDKAESSFEEFRVVDFIKEGN